MRRAASILLIWAAPLAMQLAVVPHAGAQGVEVAIADRAPRFLYAASARATPVVIEPRTMAALRRRVTLHLDAVPLREALEAISRQAGLRLFYSKDLLPLEQLVRIRAEDLTVAAALTEVLFDTDVDVLLGPNNQAALVRRGAALQSGTITGRVTDARTETGVAGVRVFLERTRWGTMTDADGRYRLAEVVPGSYTLVARRIGYKPATQAVTVEDEREVVANVVLEPAPSMLNEVVVTATGEQRLLELGHVVGRIDADSLVKAVPVSSLSELLNGRVAGLQVNTYQGTVGGEVSLQIRSPNTIQLNTTPLVIVDGVRYTSGAADRISLSQINFVEPTSPLNDLNPNDIESIEVVKGPSAATLYGTDAANGVIVITTKRGRPGPARWNAYVKGAVAEIPKIEYADAYWGWQTVGGATSPFNCHLLFVAIGFCTQDSVTVIRNPLRDPELTIFASKPRWAYGANVSGGSRDVRYFFAGDLEQATGPLRMPPALVDSISLERAVLAEQSEPNALSKVNVRSNVAVELGKAADLQLNAGYTHRTTRTVGHANGNPYASTFTFPSPAQPYGSFSPEQSFSRTSSERVSRVFASVTGRWSPTSWLLVRGVGGVDLASITRSSLARRGEAPRFFSLGEVSDDRGRQLATSGELTASASFSSGRLSSRTSVGAQYVRTVDDILGSAGTDLPPGASTIGAAANVRSRQSYREQVTLGSYVEQTVDLNQRLFLTGALRVDGASTFGRDYDAATYPKAGISWLVSEEPLLPPLPLLNELRLRYAFGASGQQPRPEWARPGYALLQRFVGGAATNVYTVNTLGNPNLRPEQVREHEFGFDASALESRVEVGLTWYRRKTVDQIVSLNLPPGLGTMQTNLGLTSGRGFEAQISARLLDSRAVSWYIVFQHSFHRTTLQDLGGAAERRSAFGGWAEGYPLGARFARPLVSYEDANGDGVIVASEVQLGDTLVYAGESRPPRSQTLTSSVTFFDGRLRLSALLERRSGFTQRNSLHQSQCSVFRCRGVVDPTTPLAEQAVAAAAGRFDYGGVIEPGDFTRFREVGIAVDLPAAMTRALRLGSATLALQGRNLALWTSYSGADPESSFLGSTAQELGIPQGRTWALRLDIGF